VYRCVCCTNWLLLFYQVRRKNFTEYKFELRVWHQQLIIFIPFSASYVPYCRNLNLANMSMYASIPLLVFVVSCTGIVMTDRSPVKESYKIYTDLDKLWKPEPVLPSGGMYYKYLKALNTMHLCHYLHLITSKCTTFIHTITNE
jgi:hypothetical protein